MSERTIDFSQGRWGHDAGADPLTADGARISVYGWSTPLPEVGDYIILRNRGSTTRYRMTEVRPCENPPDMFFGTADFAPCSR